MEKRSFTMEFDAGGTHYAGWATPSDPMRGDGRASSYHVVLNGIFFGSLSFDKGVWVVDEQRPQELIAAAGNSLDQSIRQGKIYCY